MKSISKKNERLTIPVFVPGENYSFTKEIDTYSICTREKHGIQYITYPYRTRVIIHCSVEDTESIYMGMLTVYETNKAPSLTKRNEEIRLTHASACALASSVTQCPQTNYWHLLPKETTEEKKKKERGLIS